jgi:large subunit ribosomal protein L1
MMALVGKNWGIVLGPRGKMPVPLPPNANVADFLSRAKNTIRVKTKKHPIVHAPIGTDDMSSPDLAENLQAVYTAVERVIPHDNISSVYLKMTMGEAVKLW